VLLPVRGDIDHRGETRVVPVLVIRGRNVQVLDAPNVTFNFKRATGVQPNRSSSGAIAYPKFRHAVACERARDPTDPTCPR
jgi:hypothetical protein